MGSSKIQINALVMEVLGLFALNYIGGTTCLHKDSDALAIPLAHGLALGIFIWIGAGVRLSMWIRLASLD